MSPANRPLGLKIIITYKVVKSSLVLVLAIWMTARPRSAVFVAEVIAREISEGGAMFARVGSWLEQHLTSSGMLNAAAFAWLDSLSTGAEALLLLRGHAWGEWIVVAGLAILVPIEAVSLERDPSPFKLAVLVVNAGIVAYLVRLRVRSRRVETPVSGPTSLRER